MGYGSIILVIGAIIVVGVLVLTTESATSDADRQINEYHHKELARDAAVTGMQLTLRRLADAPNTGSWDAAFASANSFPTTPYGTEGSFRVDLTSVNGDTILAAARGFNGFRRDPATGNTVPISQVIFARLAREYADGGIPPMFRNVVTTDNFIHLQGTLGLHTIDPQINANVHTNGNLSTNGNNFLVEGYGTYTNGNMTNQANNFVPNVDHNGPASNVFWADSTHIVLADLNALQGHALSSGSIIDTGGVPFTVDGSVTPVIDFRSPGSWPWAGTYSYNCTSVSCGTKDNPFVMYARQSVNFVHRIEFRGYGVIFVNGNVFILPQADGGGVFGQVVNGEAALMLGSTQVIDVAAGTPGITTCLGLGPGSSGNGFCGSGGQYTKGVTMYAQTRIEFRGSPFLVGGAVSAEVNFEAVVDPVVFFAPPLEEITDLGFEFDVPIGPVLVSYSEW